MPEDSDSLYALYHQDLDSETLKMAQVLVDDPWGIPYVLELPKPAAIRLLRAVAALVADMHERLDALEAVHHVDDSLAVSVSRWLRDTYASAAIEEANAATEQSAGEPAGEEVIRVLRGPQSFEIL